MRTKKSSVIPVAYIDLSTRFHNEICPDTSVGNGGRAKSGYSVWEEAQKFIDDWRQRIPVDEMIELTATIEWKDGKLFECELHMPHASEPCISEECNLAVHLRRFLDYDAGLREYWAPTRIATRRYLADGFLHPERTLEEMDRNFDTRNEERKEEVLEMLTNREVPTVPTSTRDPNAELGVLLYRMSGREVELWEVDAHSWEHALDQVATLPDAALRPLAAEKRDRMLSFLLQHEEQRVRLAGMQLSARLANLSPVPKVRKVAAAPAR